MQQEKTNKPVFGAKISWISFTFGTDCMNINAVFKMKLSQTLALGQLCFYEPNNIDQAKKEFNKVRAIFSAGIQLI